MSTEKELLILALQNKLELLIEDYSNKHNYYSISMINFFNVLKNKYENNANDLNFIYRLESGNDISNTHEYINHIQIHSLRNITLIQDLFKIFDSNYDFTKELEIISPSLFTH